MSMQEIILLFAEVVKAAIPFVTVFFFGGYIVSLQIKSQAQNRTWRKKILQVAGK